MVILSKQTLTPTQKNVLRKGLSFIPKPKSQTLKVYIMMLDYSCTLNFNTNHNQIKPETHLEYPKKSLHPERLSDNKTLDTFLHRVRLEILDEYKHKQNKADHLTRQERQAINNKPTLIVIKQIKDQLLWTKTGVNTQMKS